jgi:hypothetical protein
VVVVVVVVVVGAGLMRLATMLIRAQAMQSTIG